MEALTSITILKMKTFTYPATFLRRRKNPLVVVMETLSPPSLPLSILPLAFSPPSPFLTASCSPLPLASLTNIRRGYYLHLRVRFVVCVLFYPLVSSEPEIGLVAKRCLIFFSSFFTLGLSSLTHPLELVRSLR